MSASSSVLPPFSPRATGVRALLRASATNKRQSSGGADGPIGEACRAPGAAPAPADTCPAPGTITRAVTATRVPAPCPCNAALADNVARAGAAAARSISARASGRRPPEKWTCPSTIICGVYGPDSPRPPSGDTSAPEPT